MSGVARGELAAVERLLDEAVGAVFPAAQLLVVDADEIVLDRAAGDCDKATLFDLASLTKALVTTTLTMRLVGAERLSLYDEVREDVTVRSALCHAGGLPPWRPLFLHASEAVNPRRAIIDAARAEPLDAAPGSRSAYSDLGFILLGDVVEEHGGAQLDEQLASIRDIYGGADCRATFHPDPSACAVTEGDLRGEAHDDNCRAMGGVSGHAGLFGSAADVAAMVRSLLRAFSAGDDDTADGEGPLVVSPAVLRLFWSPSGVPGSSWCLGWDRPTQTPGGVSQAGTRFSRSGVGHLGFTGCSVWVDPPRRRYIILLSNRVHPTRDNERIKLFRPLLHDAIACALDGGGP